MKATTLKGLWPTFEFKPHQEAGVIWMLNRENGDGVHGGILCDEMGLGKTIQMVALIKNGIKKIREQNLLVAPVAVLEQWKKVLYKTGLTVKIPSKSGVSWVTEGPVKSLIAAELHCIGYEAATRHPTLLRLFKWTRLIYDEAHRIASGNSGTELALKIKADNKWMLTGTPIVNRIRDLSTLLEIVGVDKVPYNNIDNLKPIVKKYVLARTMDQLRKLIPDAPKKPIYISKLLEFITDEEREFYSSKVEVIATRLDRLKKNNSRGAALERLKLLMRLRQVSLHPQIYNQAQKARLGYLWEQPDWEGTSTKFHAIRTLISETTGSHKWIVFCHFRHEMNMLNDMLLAESSVELVQQYHGGLTASEKEDVIERSHLPIMEGKQEIMLVQLQSGGTGLNLQHFDHIVFTGPWWTKALMEQAVGRAVRIGQKKQVMVYHLKLISEEDEDGLNIDDFMTTKALMKGELCRAVLAAATKVVDVADLST